MTLKTETTNVLKFPQNWRPATKEECDEAYRKLLAKRVAQNPFKESWI